MHNRRDIAVSVRSLGKSYTITHQKTRHSTLAETVLDRMRNPLQQRQRETFEALNDVSFDIHKGDVLGVIGRNGAGKSTLLKLLSRITEPTRGEIKLYGRVGSLLEVGTGFHPELTAHENIYLNGSVLGMSRSEVRQQFDAIVDFANVEQFLDTPVKRFSSGMYVRLAFAVAAHLQSEIMVIDEVLAVGDVEFQRKCLGKMKEVASGGRTVLFVSHHMQSVHALCDRAIFLSGGRIAYDGGVDQAVEHYIKSFDSAKRQTESMRRPGTGEFRFVEVACSKEVYACADTKTIRFRIQQFRAFTGKLFVSCLVYNELGVAIVQCDSRLLDVWFNPKEICEGEFVLQTPWLKPGEYRIDFFICSAGIIDELENACRLTVAPFLPYSSGANPETTDKGIVFSDFAFRELP